MADFFGHILKVPFTDNPEPIKVIEPLYITAAGRITVGDNSCSVQLAAIGLGTAPTDDGVTIVPTAVSNKGMLIQALADQTANLLEIQEDGGTVKLSVDASGNLLIAGALNHDGSTLGFYGTTPASQASDVGSMTLTTGTPDNTLTDVSGTGDDSTVNSNFADVGDQLNDIRTVLRNVGLMA